MSSMLALERRGEVALLRMAHGKANALDIEFCQELRKTMKELEASDARAVVLTAEGAIFSAGVDLIRALEGGPDYLRRFLPQFRDFCQAMFIFPKPLVAAINGHAVAGGCILACMADLRLMARGPIRVGVPELMVGVPFPPTPLELIRFTVPARYFAEVLYSGTIYSPQEAAAKGLIDEVIDPAQLLERAEGAARELASLPDQTFRMTKEQIRRPVLEQMQDREQKMGAAVETIWTSPGTLNAIRSYVEKTFKPRDP